jgi:hypothetical protein
MAVENGPPLSLAEFRREVQDKLSVTYYNGIHGRMGSFPTRITRQCEEFLVELYDAALKRIARLEET